jgi:hypothetical protein
MSGWIYDLQFLLSGDGVGTNAGPNKNLFVSSQKVLPAGAGPFLSLVETGGSTPENTQNSTIVPAYQRPGAQIVVRADSYPDAYAMARAAYNSLVKVRNQFVGSGYLSPTGTWYRKIRPLQEPFDMGLDADGRPRVTFNVIGDKRPSVFPPPVPATPWAPILAPAIFQLIEDLGGDANGFVAPLGVDAYLVGATFDKLVPTSHTVVLNRAALYLGTYVLEASARVGVVAGARAKVGLFDLTNSPDTPLVEIEFTPDEMVGERKRSSGFVIPASDTTFGVKMTTNDIAVSSAVWGCRILRV